MKTSDFLKTLVAAAVLFMAIPSFAQEGRGKRDEGWKDRMKSEKIAFLTNELSLTPEEAQVFWPVYNQGWEERDKSHFEVMQAYRALEQAVSDGKSDKELSSLLESYLDAIGSEASLEKNQLNGFLKILSTEKVARLYLAEEKFRREQIHRLHQGGGPKGGFPGKDKIQK
ncbi:MAG: hypothetical protein ACI395_03260 [Candidatus Cryptobacteroides sp.]